MSRAIGIIALLLVTASNLPAVPISLVGPNVYDNQGGGVSGQLFISESIFVSGVRWYIGDPTRPNNDNVDALQGTADLVIYDAADLNLPVQLARTQIQGAAGVTEGFTTFLFSVPVPVLNGHSYFIGLDAAGDSSDSPRLVNPHADNRPLA